MSDFEGDHPRKHNLVHSSPARDQPGAAQKKRKSDASTNSNTARTSQACTRCRSLKMKCIGATDPPCRRCRRMGTQCEFVARANAAVPLSPGPYPSSTCTELWRGDVNARLRALEETNMRLEGLLMQRAGNLSRDSPLDMVAPGPEGLGLRLDYPVDGQSQDGGHGIAVDGRNRGRIVHDDDSEPEQVDFPSEQGSHLTSGLDRGSASGSGSVGSVSGTRGGKHDGVLVAIERLKAELPHSLIMTDAWSPAIIRRLLESFRDHMPGLHFLEGKNQVSFTRPTPTLAVSILYMAAAHYPSADLARHQPTYFQAFTRAIGMLALPDSPICGRLEHDGEGPVSGKFDDTLAIILVGLLAGPGVDTIPTWVNIAYRLLLDGMAEERGHRQAAWHGLWEGLRTIELEHLSLHLNCPGLPRSLPNPPFPPLPESLVPRDAGSSIGELLEIMQRFLPRFVGRGLPTIWESVSSICNRPGNRDVMPDDITALRSWAVEIDASYCRTAAQTVNSSMYVRSIVALNYFLHKLYVLSIVAAIASPAPAQREELLDTARVVLRIEATGYEVWSSWDLVMITNASLILLQAWAAGAATVDDLNLIQNHLNALTCTQQAAPSLRHTLATRLETALQQVRTPVRPQPPVLPVHSPTNTTAEATAAAESAVVEMAKSTWSMLSQQGARPSSQTMSSGSGSIPSVGPGDNVPQVREGMPGGYMAGGAGNVPGPGGYSPARGGYLFMEQAPTLGILPELPSFELDSNAITDWPPFLLNLFGDGPGPGQGPSAPPHPSSGQGNMAGQRSQ